MTDPSSAEALTLPPERRDGLLAIDEALNEMSGGQPGRRRLRAFYAAVLQSLDGVVRAHDHRLQDELFQPDWSDEQRRFVAVCLLRLLARAPQGFTGDQRFIGKAEALWDAELVDVYRLFGVDERQDSFRKRRSLQDTVPRSLRELGTVIEDVRGVVDVPSLHAVRKRWRHGIRQYESLLGPFLPSELLRQRNDELFDATAAALDADDADLLRRFQTAWDASERYDETAREFGTVFSIQICAGLAIEIRRQLERYKDSRLLQPAAVVVAAGKRKYPLHDDGREVRIELVATNSGQGPALDVRLSIEATAGFDVAQPEVMLGTLRTGNRIVELVATVDAGDPDNQLIGRIEWRNPDGTAGESSFDLEFDPQRADIDWGELERQAPYLLKAIDKPVDLIGRDSVMTSLLASVRSSDMSSCVVDGQKRVGKTSILLCLQAHLVEEFDDTVVAYLQIGKHRSSPRSLYRGIARAVSTAARTMQEHYPALGHLHKPDFEEGFAEILDLVDDVLDVDEGLRLVLVLDEFDELPSRLYQFNDEAAAFFNTLRDFVAQPRRSLMLVGGERLNFVLTANGSALNQLASHKVDRFRRDDQFADFTSLVCKPAEGVLEFEPEAIEKLYAETSGHPYFTKMICRSLVAQCVARRDANVGDREVDDAIGAALHGASITAFAHFWDDGIFESDPGRVQEIALQRRLALLAVARALGTQAGPTKGQIELEAQRIDLETSELVQALSSLEQRGVVMADGERVVPRLPFFRRWLESYGPSAIVTHITDEKARARLEADVDQSLVSPHEISRVVQAWGVYRSRSVNGDDVRRWLAQFGSPLDQRRALRVLKHVRLYSSVEVRERFAAGHQRIVAGVTRSLAQGEKTFTDVLIVPLAAKSDPEWTYGSLYAAGGRIHKQNIVEIRYLADRLAATKRTIRMVVFVDDFIGSGEHAIEHLSYLDPAGVGLLNALEVPPALVTACAFKDGVARVEGWLSEADLRLSVMPHELFDERERCFDPASTIFDDAADRSATRELFERLGKRIEPTCPLGFADVQALVAFEPAVPNNALPHLWSNGTRDGEWFPLFPRS